MRALIIAGFAATVRLRRALRLIAATMLLPLAAQAAEREWTFLVFLNGKSNLDSWAQDNLVEMQQFGSSEKIDVVVQWASIEKNLTQRLHVTRTAEVIEDLGPNVDMGDWKNLVEFIRWGVEHYPAKKYFIDVWDHGTGWHPEGARRTLEISHDEKTGHWISTRELGLAMEAASKIMGHKVDLLGSDACEMAMMEIATEVAPFTRIFAASEADIPLKGWPYAELLRDWAKIPDADAPDVARLLTREYLDAFSGGVHGKANVTFSAYNLEREGPLLKALARFTEAFGKLEAPARAVAIESAIQSFSVTNDYTDLLDFLGQLTSRGILARESAEVQDAAGSYLIANGGTDRFAKAQGITIWMPDEPRWYNKYLDLYRQLRFSKLTGWEKGLKAILHAPKAPEAFPPQTDQYSDVQAFLHALADSHKDSTKIVPVGMSDFGVPIETLRIGDGSGPHHLVVATHHGNEYGSTEVAKALAASLASEPIAGRTIYVLPVLNVQGYNWKSRGEDIGPSSHDPNRDYPGPCGTEGPFRLKSTAALAKFLDTENIVATATLHTYRPAVVWPWGFATPDLDTEFTDLFRKLAQAATVESQYQIGNSTDVIYPAAGTYEDYAFWKHGVWSLLFELGRTHKPYDTQIADMVSTNVPGLRRLLEVAPAERAPRHEFTGKCEARLLKLDRHDE